MATGDLQHAILVASRAHEGHTDRQGEPYIAHSVRVMLDVEGDDERCVAVLHDVLEWGSITRHELAEEHFPEPIVEAVDALTSKPDEEIEAFIERVRSSELAVPVKIADLRDNAQQWRLDTMPDAETRANLLAQYRRSAELLGTTLDEICGRRVV
jgi:(p)ppGpp synthase/HD superfamily hydrolase